MFGFGGGGPFMDIGNNAFGTMFGVNTQAENTQSKAAGKTFDMAEQYWNQTDPVRSGVIDRLAKFVKGGFDPSTSPLFAQQKNSIEQQYGTAKDNLLAALPGGGAINEGVTGLEVGRANSLIDTLAQIFNQEYMASLGMATTSPETAFMGMGTGGDINKGTLDSQSAKQVANMNAFGNIGSSFMSSFF